MRNETLKTAGDSASGRIFFVDNLRTMLVILVILHHFAVIYAANTLFYYMEPSKEILPTVILSIFQMFNQAYFMGLYFLLSGYFTPVSFDRKGLGKFLKDRLLRFGIPLLISAFSAGMCLGLITLCRKRFNRQGKFGHLLSKNAFTVYVIHAPLITWLARILYFIPTHQGNSGSKQYCLGGLILICFF